MSEKDYFNDLEKYKACKTPEEKAAFEKYLFEKHSNLPADEAMENLKMIDNRIEELKDIVRLGEITEIVSLSYIAKKYFGKSRHWLYQRLNGVKINGKPVFLNAEQKEQLKFALNDISKKLQETSFQI